MTCLIGCGGFSRPGCTRWSGPLTCTTGGEPKAQNLSILGPRFAWDAAAQVQGSGQCTILWDDLFGQSVAPREIGDLFSPFGAELQVDVVVSAGAFRERVSMGRFVLDSVPASVEYAIRNPLGVSRKPSYGPWVEQARNRLINPSAEANAATWIAARATVTRDTTKARYGQASFKVTPTSDTAEQYFINGSNPGDRAPVTGGETVHVVASVWMPRAVTVAVQLYEYTAAGVLLTPVATTSVGVIDGGGWVDLSANLTVKPTAASVRVAVVPQTLAVGEAYWVDGLALGAPHYLDGSTAPDGVLERTRWLGTPNASASVLETRVQVGVGETTLGTVPVVAESTVTLDLADYFLRIARDSFPFPESPKSTSMWDEAQRLTGLPVFRSIPDRVLPTNITYDEDRLEALGKAFGPSNAWPALTPVGALTARPKDWPAPVGRIENVIDITAEMRSENVYNRVVVEGKNPNPDGPALIAVAEVTDGFLRVRNQDGSRSPFGGNTYRYSSEFLTTQAQCQAYANDLLPRVSRLRSVTRTVTVPFDPLVEIGDVTTLVDPTRQGEETTVRVRSVAHEDTETKLVVEVQDAP